MDHHVVHHIFLTFCFLTCNLTSGPVAQWIRHRPTEPGIAGSSPAGVTYFHDLPCSSLSHHFHISATTAKCREDQHTNSAARTSGISSHPVLLYLSQTYCSKLTPYFLLLRLAELAIPCRPSHLTLATKTPLYPTHGLRCSRPLYSCSHLVAKCRL